MAQALLKLGYSVTIATGRYGDSPSNFTEDEIKVGRVMSWRRAARPVTSASVWTKTTNKFSSKIVRG